MAKAPKAKRYAQALFALAQEKGREQEWLDDLQQAARLFDDGEVRLFLTTPRVPAQRKLAMVKDLLRAVDPIVVNMMGLLLARQSIDLLPEIQQEYRKSLDESLGRVYASVTTAVPLTTAQAERLQQSLGQALEREVVLDLHQDAEIIGGLVVWVGDQIMDGSVRTRLAALHQRLAQESLA